MKNSWIFLLLMGFASCGGEENYTPKPRGYFRISLPAKEYQIFENDCGYSFEYNQNAEWQPHQKEDCWGDIYYPDLKARLQLTYKNVDETGLETLLEDGHKLAYKHTVKADGISEKLFADAASHVYGILYQLQGDAASNAQFFMTDSTQNFLRGVLYFYAEPNADSLRPANEFMQGEIAHLIETLEWQNSSP